MQTDIADLIDPQTGRLVSHRPFTHAELAEAGRLGILGPRGQNFAQVERPIDPLSREVLECDAPEGLIEVVNRARLDCEQAEKFVEQAWNERDNAIATIRDFDQQFSGNQLTESGYKRRIELVNASVQSHQHLKEAQDLHGEARAAILKAELALNAWVHEERQRREEATQAEHKVKVKEPATVVSLADRLTSLKSKFIG